MENSSTDMLGEMENSTSRPSAHIAASSSASFPENSNITSPRALNIGPGREVALSPHALAATHLHVTLPPNVITPASLRQYYETLISLYESSTRYSNDTIQTVTSAYLRPDQHVTGLEETLENLGAISYFLGRTIHELKMCNAGRYEPATIYDVADKIKEWQLHNVVFAEELLALRRQIRGSNEEREAEDLQTSSQATEALLEQGVGRNNHSRRLWARIQRVFHKRD